MLLKRLQMLMKFQKRFVTYIQGQNPEPKIREYFYYIDHQGMLFLDDTKIKNFTSCFKDKIFLDFFFKRIKVNHLERYGDDFPYISLCGRERNFVRCDDRPIVFLQLKQIDSVDHLIYAYPDSDMKVIFTPEHLFMHPMTLRLYHPAPNLPGGIGLVKSSLSMELSNNFHWNKNNATNELPVSFVWRDFKYQLTHSLLDLFRREPQKLKGMHVKTLTIPS